MAGSLKSGTIRQLFGVDYRGDLYRLRKSIAINEFVVIFHSSVQLIVLLDCHDTINILLL